jgi:protein-S-isoprenylcysteine O-methyltransferase Ste14
MAGARAPIGDAVKAAAQYAAIVGALLLLPAGVAAGRWVWMQGLAFVAGFGLVELAGYLALAIWRPAHFKVRQQGLVAAPDRKQPKLDAVGSVATNLFAAAWVVFIPIDALRLHLLPAAPSWISAVALGGSLIGAALTPIAVWENRFAAPNVQDQSAEGQRIVDTGVYRLIRHPIYLGNLLLFGGMALWLGSTAAFAGMAVFLVATIGRITLEERELRARLPAYADYARRVRGRLIPFVL